MILLTKLLLGRSTYALEIADVLLLLGQLGHELVDVPLHPTQGLWQRSVLVLAVLGLGGVAQLFDAHGSI